LSLQTYVSRRVLLLTLLAGLFIGVAAAPIAAIAQADANVESGKTALNTEEKKSESENVDVYRHSATVQWVSNLIHVDVETTAKSFEYINFAIILLAVGIPLIKVLPKVFRKRSETLSKELETARTATTDANARLAVVEAKLAGLNAEIEQIRTQVEQDMRDDEVRIKATIGEESARIVAAAEQEIQIAGALAQRGLKQFAADLAIEGAMKKLTLNADTDRALIAEFAADSKAGRN